MLFDFESDENIVKEKQPSCKPIKKQGLWIADDNMSGSEWRKSCSNKCNENCKDHYVNTKPYDVIARDDDGGDLPIPGRIIINAKICVLRRTGLLKLGNKNMYCGKWVKGDGEFKDEYGKRKYACGRRYLLIFLDDDNKPLHKVPVQATFKGTFQIDFDNALVKFRSEAKNAYFTATCRRQGLLKEQWYTVWVFQVKFGSRVVGAKGMRSEACCIDSYEVPTKENWESLCVGRDVEVNEFLSYHFMNSERWAAKYEKDKEQPSPADVDLSTE